MLGIFSVPVFPVAGSGLSTGADFLNVTTGARPAAMGQAFSALSDDINSLAVNPAGLGNLRLPQIAFSHYQFFSDIAYDFMAAGIPLGPGGTLGLSYLGLGVQPFNSTVNSLAAPGTDSEGALTAGWGDAWGIFQAGAALKYIYRNVGTVSGKTWAADLGIRLRPLTRLSFAGSLLNMGPSIDFSSGESLPSNLKLGAAWRALEYSEHSLDIACETNVALASSQLPRFGFGMEYWYKDLCALRAGYLAGTTSEGFTAGAGLQLYGLEVDYAYQPFDQLGATNRVSGLYRWEGPWISGGEFNPPRLLTFRTSPQGAVASWIGPKGPVDHYDLTVVLLEDGKARVFDNIPNSPVVLKHLKEGVLYKAEVVAVGKGGGRSMPSNTAYLKTYNENPSTASSATRSQGELEKMQQVVSGSVQGQVDEVGLRLSWEPIAGYPVKGYLLYRKSPEGRLEKLTDRPKKGNVLWVNDLLDWKGSEWIVTAVNAQDETEKTVGSYIWNSGSKDEAILKTHPKVQVSTTAQKEGKVLMEWEHSHAAGSMLLVSRSPEHVFESVGKLNTQLPKNLLKGFEKGQEYLFIVVNLDKNGAWIGHSREVSAKISH